MAHIGAPLREIEVEPLQLPEPIQVPEPEPERLPTPTPSAPKREEPIGPVYEPV